MSPPVSLCPTVVFVTAVAATESPIAVPPALAGSKLSAAIRAAALAAAAGSTASTDGPVPSLLCLPGVWLGLPFSSVALAAASTRCNACTCCTRCSCSCQPSCRAFFACVSSSYRNQAAGRCDHERARVNVYAGSAAWDVENDQHLHALVNSRSFGLARFRTDSCDMMHVCFKT